MLYLRGRARRVVLYTLNGYILPRRFLLEVQGGRGVGRARGRGDGRLGRRAGDQRAGGVPGLGVPVEWRWVSSGERDGSKSGLASPNFVCQILRYLFFSIFNPVTFQ